MFSPSFLLFVNFQQLICKLLQFFLYQDKHFFFIFKWWCIWNRRLPLPLTECLLGTAFSKYHKGPELNKFFCAMSPRCTGSEEEENSKLKWQKTSLENSRSERGPGCGVIGHDKECCRCVDLLFRTVSSVQDPAGSHCFTVWTAVPDYAHRNDIKLAFKNKSKGAVMDLKFLSFKHWSTTPHTNYSDLWNTQKYIFSPQSQLEKKKTQTNRTSFWNVSNLTWKSPSEDNPTSLPSKLL